MNLLMDPLQMEPLELDSPIEPRPWGCCIPLAAEQLRVHKILQNLNPQGRAMSGKICASAVRVAGALDIGLLQASIDLVVRRHEALRTQFVSVGGNIRQQIADAASSQINIVDLSGMTEAQAEQTATALARNFGQQLTDLSMGPIFEAVLFKLPTSQHALVLLVSHMIADGISNALLTREIWDSYDASARGDQPMLPPLPVQFPDYCVWLERTHEAWRRDHEAYWKMHLEHAPRPTIPESHGLAKPLAGVTAHIRLGAALSAGLREAAKRESTFISNAMLAIYAIVMSRWCAQEDLLIISPIHGRHGRPELEHPIGLFVNRLYLRIQVRGKDTLRDLLSQVHREMQLALVHRDFDRVPHIIPGLSTELEFHWRPASWRGRANTPRAAQNQQTRRQPFLVRRPEWPLKFWSIFDDTAVGICATVHYWPHLVPPSTVERFGNHLRAVAAALVDRPEARVHSAIPVGDSSSDWCTDGSGVAIATPSSGEQEHGAL